MSYKSGDDEKGSVWMDFIETGQSESGRGE